MIDPTESIATPDNENVATQSDIDELFGDIKNDDTDRQLTPSKSQ